MAGSAAEKVFAIGELLEQILLDVPSKDIFVLQRVNKDTRATVERSSKLQQKLFLAPSHVRKGRRQRPELNPLLRSALNYATGYDTRSMPLFYLATEHNAALTTQSERFHPTTQPGFTVYCLARPHLHFLFESIGTKGSVPRASWRDMLITNPPCKEFRSEGVDGAGKVYTQTTLGDLIDAMKSGGEIRAFDRLDEARPPPRL